MHRIDAAHYYRSRISRSVVYASLSFNKAYCESWKVLLRLFSIFGTALNYIVPMDENADASQAIFEPPPENWRRPPGRPRTTWMKNIHDDMSLLDHGIYNIVFNYF